LGWLTNIFATVNHRVSNQLSRIPTTYEVGLDLTFIAHLSSVSVPVKLPSSWTVWIETHFLGGMRHFMGWEIADIGVLVTFRHKGRLRRSKIALLQSKRLYADELHIDEDTPMMYQMGFRRLHHPDGDFSRLTASLRLRPLCSPTHRPLLASHRRFDR